MNLWPGTVLQCSERTSKVIHWSTGVMWSKSCSPALRMEARILASLPWRENAFESAQQCFSSSKKIGVGGTSKGGATRVERLKKNGFPTRWVACASCSLILAQAVSSVACNGQRPSPCSELPELLREVLAQLRLSGQPYQGPLHIEK